MQSFAVSRPANKLEEALGTIKAIDPNLVIMFATPSLLHDKAATASIRAALPYAALIGCSTSGEIGPDGVNEGSVTLTGIRFDKATFKTAATRISAAGLSGEAGATIAKELAGADLKCIFVLAPGLNVNGSELVKGLASQLTSDVIVTGGLAGDGVDFKKTYTCLNGDVYSDHVIAIGLYGSSLQISTGSQGGWKPFGPARRVTKAEGNILYELDGKPALELYKEYLGDKAQDLPASGLLYPLAILREDRSTSGLIRTILDVDHAKGSLILAGELPEKSLVCLMHANTDALTGGSSAAAAEANSEGADKGLAILISCVGRRLVMGQDVDDEIDAVRAVLGKDASLTGFYSYGEICPSAETGRPELHNQTMTITFIRERDAA
jgi:hypothetical protein